MFLQGERHGEGHIIVIIMMILVSSSPQMLPIPDYFHIVLA